MNINSCHKQKIKSSVWRQLELIARLKQYKCKQIMAVTTLRHIGPKMVYPQMVTYPSTNRPDIAQLCWSMPMRYHYLQTTTAMI